MTEELKLPNMYMTPAGAVYNHLESGAIQIIHGVRMLHLAGIYERAQDDDFVVNIPCNGSGGFVTHYISQVLAINVDWIKVNAQIVNYWKAQKITTEEIKTMDIGHILERCEIVDVDPAGRSGMVKDDFHWTNPTEPPHVIDVAYTAIPIHEVKD